MLRMSLIKMVELMGVAGILVFFAKRLGLKLLPIKVPVFGTIRTRHELRNIFDNFGIYSLIRDKTIEKYLSKAPNPCVIDCGVNVGITVRWWFHLNRQAKVYGVDMLAEAHQFTDQAIKFIGIDEESYTPVQAALWSENGKQFKVGIGDPLNGDHGLFQGEDKNKNERIFTTRTLDSIFTSQNLDEVDLLKIDLEGAGVETLKGATQLLQKTKHVLIESHSKELYASASKILTDNRFLLRKVTSRNSWWEKTKSSGNEMLFV